MEKEPRTLQQNRAIHKYFELVAETLNDAGLEMRKVLKPGIEIPWMKETVKDHLWRPVQDLMLGKRSTTELTKDEIDKVYEVMNRHLGKFGVHVPFPSIENLDEEIIKP